MSTSPLAGALKPHVLAPPYKGTTLTSYRGIFVSGNCKSAYALTGMNWVPNTGNVTGFAYDSAKSCTTFPPGNGSAAGYTNGEFRIGFPVKVYTNVGHNFSVDFSYTYTVNVSVAGAGVCPVAKNIPGTPTYSSCTWYASAGSKMWMELYDQTNNSYLWGQHFYVFGPKNDSEQDNSSWCDGRGTCTSFNSGVSCFNPALQPCVPSGTMATGSNTAWITPGNNCQIGYAGYCYSWHNWTLNSTHRYWILAWVYFYAIASVYGWPAGRSVHANVNGATFGNTGWRITSVTVT
ncbi:MAG TPA: hypothetical protein VFF67_04120 [Thermoplasmata archaeon]|nr:hypothetical protein [Thermoplasmata archaeon]